MASASVLSVLLLSTTPGASAAPPTGLQLSFMDEPAGVDTLGPHHFTWARSDGVDAHLSPRQHGARGRGAGIRIRAPRARFRAAQVSNGIGDC